MPRHPRFPLGLKPGAEPQLLEITCRVIHGLHLLRPSPELRAAILGILARAGTRTAVQLHAFAFLSNHYHLLVSTNCALALAQFCCYLNSNLAREAGRLCSWTDRFWGRRYQAILVSDEPEAQLARLCYVLAQGTKERLVASPLDWPGAHCAAALLEGTPLLGRWHDRTSEYRAKERGHKLSPAQFIEETSFVLAPLPALADLPPDRQRQEVALMLRSIEEESAAQGAPRGVDPSNGALVPSIDVPQGTRLKKRPAPLVHAWHSEVRRRMVQAFRDFLVCYRACSERLRSGHAAEFPAGCFPPALPFVAARPG